MLVPDLNALTPLQTVKPTSANLADGAQDKEALKAVAKDFEAAFIAQMLTHSGLAESLTSGEGKMAAAFGSFYVEQLAERMSDQGGIGMADSIYKQLERYGEAGETS
ncbi:MAG: rod-binding protein [Litorimonas sp.]